MNTKIGNRNNVNILVSTSYKTADRAKDELIRKLISNAEYLIPDWYENYLKIQIDPFMRDIYHLTSEEGKKLICPTESSYLDRILNSDRESSIENMSSERVFIGSIMLLIAWCRESNSKPPICINNPESKIHPAYHTDFINFLHSCPQHEFYIATTSPYIIKEVPQNCITVYYEDSQGNVNTYNPSQSLGLNIAEISQGILGIPIINSKIDSEIKRIYSLIDEDRFHEAKKATEKLEEITKGSIPETVQILATIEMFQSD